MRTTERIGVNPHAHTLALDGVYVRGEDGELSFHELPAPSAAEVADVAPPPRIHMVRYHGVLILQGV